MAELVTYGCTQKFKSQFGYDKWAFANPLLAKDTPPRDVLFQRIADTMVPGRFEWHDWTKRFIHSVTHHKWSAFSGCSSSGKTWNAANFACVWWLCDPPNSSVILCSTTMKMLRARIWAQISGFKRDFDKKYDELGLFLDSQTIWKNGRGDDLHAIFGKAVRDGNVDDAAADIQGIHTRRQLVVIDEAPAVPTAIWKACANLYSYPSDNGEFILIALGNARSRLDPFGRFIEPANGWDSVSPENEGWIGKQQMGGEPSQVTLFNFKRSPNVVAAKTVSKHMPTKKRVEERLKELAARGAENDPEHWCFDLGFPAPEGLTKTVFTETMLMKFNAYGQHEFSGKRFTIIGTFDPARTGDRPTVRFFALGELLNGKLGIEWMKGIPLYTDATSADPIDYQLVWQCRQKCENVQYRGQRYVCQPENFAFDCTGGGADIADIASREWSPKIIRIMFSGSCSTDSVSDQDPRPANEVYLNKRAEMYYSTKYGVEAGLIKGVDQEVAVELCAMRWEIGQRGLIKMEDKEEYKKRMTVSPDLADTGIMGTEVARQRGFQISFAGQSLATESPIAAHVEQAESIHDGESFASEQETSRHVEDDAYAAFANDYE